MVEADEIIPLYDLTNSITLNSKDMTNVVMVEVGFDETQIEGIVQNIHDNSM